MQYILQFVYSSQIIIFFILFKMVLSLIALKSREKEPLTFQVPSVRHIWSENQELLGATPIKLQWQAYDSDKNILIIFTPIPVSFYE